MSSSTSEASTDSSSSPAVIPSTYTLRRSPPKAFGARQEPELSFWLNELVPSSRSQADVSRLRQQSSGFRPPLHSQEGFDESSSPLEQPRLHDHPPTCQPILSPQRTPVTRLPASPPRAHIILSTSLSPDEVSPDQASQDPFISANISHIEDVTRASTTTQRYSLLVPAQQRTTVNLSPREIDRRAALRRRRQGMTIRDRASPEPRTSGEGPGTLARFNEIVDAFGVDTWRGRVER